MPYKISTLLYCFDARDRVLLLERSREPNAGFWSPCGGKLHTAAGESPHACAAREAGEELQISAAPGDFQLTGVVSEAGLAGQAHWLMFLFELKPRLPAVPEPIAEGRFAFFERSRLADLKIPQTDREMIWPLFWRHRGGFFAAHCVVTDGGNQWHVEESRPFRTDG